MNFFLRPLPSMSRPLAAVLSLLAFSAGASVLPASVTNFTGAQSDRFGIAGNWDNELPAPGKAGIVNSRRVEVATLNEMVVGATLDFNGSSLLERNSFSQAAYSGVLNINDTTNVNISSWWPENNSVLNWNSSGTFGVAPAGPHNQARLYIQTLRDNAVVNINNGFWDMRGDTSAFSVRVFSGTVNFNRGLMIADKQVSFGAGFANSSGFLNLGRHAEMRVQRMGLFVASVLNFESGAALYFESGLLGFFGDEGLVWLRDMLRQTDARGIQIDGVRQVLGATEDLDQSNFLTTTVEIDGIWYNAMLAGAPPLEVTEDGGDWVLRLPGKRGFAYQARTATSLDAAPGSWSDVGGSVNGAGAPLEIRVSKAAHPADPARFFAVEISAIPAF